MPTGGAGREMARVSVSRDQGRTLSPSLNPICFRNCNCVRQRRSYSILCNSPFKLDVGPRTGCCQSVNCVRSAHGRACISCIMPAGQRKRGMRPGRGASGGRKGGLGSVSGLGSLACDRGGGWQAAGVVSGRQDGASPRGRGKIRG